MTGFGRATGSAHGREISVELRSVNHRYLEISARVPRSYSFIEDKLKTHIQRRVSRGKLDVGVTVTCPEESDTRVELNLKLAQSYAQAVAQISSELGLCGDMTAATLARFPDVFTFVREQPDEDEIWNDVKAVLDDALESYCTMRALEGERLVDDMLSRVDFIEKALTEVENVSGTRLERYREKLCARMQTVLEGIDIDDNRILLEAAIYADKSAVDEETVRLRSHLDQFRSILDAKEPVGRKLDFLIQEINRETNTIGSKAGDLDVTSAVVDIKAEIEKIREQVQNIE